MKKFLLLALSMLLLFSLLGCNNEKSNETSNDTSNGESDELYTVDTEYYTISVPFSWKSDAHYEIVEGEGSAYTLTFYDKASRDSGNGGELFSIVLLTEYEDYSEITHHKALGSLEISQIGSYNIVVTYPSEAQYSDQTAEKYNEMKGKVDQILDSIAFNDKCVFSETPIPVKEKKIISRANGNWKYSANGVDGINLIIFADGSFIKADTVNGATSPEKIITGTYEILSDDGTYQEFHFIPTYEVFEDWTATIYQTRLFDQDLLFYEALIYISADGTQSNYRGEKFPN